MRVALLVFAGVAAAAPAPPEDWVAAFKTAHAKVKSKYAFTVWKGIDWDARAATAEAAIAAAQQKGDEEALFWAVREYVFVGDGHEALSDPHGYYAKSIAGGYGIQLTTLTDGRVVVVYVADGSAAARAGVGFGAEVAEWGGAAAAAALAAVPPSRFYLSAPTEEGRRRQREMLLPRAPVGASVSATFANVGGGQVTVQLTAVKDGWRPIVREMEYLWPFGGPITPDMPGRWGGEGGEFDGPSHGSQYRILTAPNVGYYKLMTEDTGDAPLFVSHATAAVKLFNAMQVRGVVVDLRGNNGGDDQPSADFVSLFYTGSARRPYPYKDINVGTVKPNAGAFPGPVAVLTDHLCVSDCEGIAYALRDALPNRTRYFSWDETTVGAFGLIDDTNVKFPGGITLKQLMEVDGESMKGRKFLIEADGTGKGGVPADVVIPATIDNLRRRYEDGADLPLEAAVRWLRGAAPAPPTPAAARYHCDTTAGTCAASAEGHATMAKCMAACGAPSPPAPAATYKCDGGRCATAAGGLSKSACAAICSPPSPPAPAPSPPATYKCDNGNCVVVAGGIPKSDCEKICA